MSDQPAKPSPTLRDFAAYLRSRGLEGEARVYERLEADRSYARRLGRAEWRERHRWLTAAGMVLGVIAMIALISVIGIGWALIIRGTCR